MEAVTRICTARKYAPETWLRLLRESASKNGGSSTDNELYSAAVDILLPLILAEKATASSSDTIVLKTYLHTCLQASETGKQNTLFRLLDLVRSSASSEVTSQKCEDISLIMLEGFPQSLSSLPSGYAQVSLSLLASAANFSLPALFILALTLLCRPVTLDRSLFQPLEHARTALYSISPDSVIIPDQVQLAMKCLNDIDRRLDPSISRKRKRTPALPRELETLLQYILDNQAEHAEEQLRASLRARLAYEQAFGLDRGTAGWLEDLIAICVGKVVGETRQAARWRSFVYGVLPNILRAVEVEISDALVAKYETVGRWLTAAPQETRLPSEISLEGLAAALSAVAQEYAFHNSASSVVLQQVQAYIASSDLTSLATLLRSLTLESQVLDLVLLNTPPSTFLQPIEQLLATWDVSEDYGAGQAMEIYGSLQLSVWVISAHCTRPFSIPHAIYSLEALSHEQQVLVSSWITALYGNEGIDDELLRSTHPRTMLALAPTIVHQSLKAHELGIIDTETLQGGLSYFTQDLLNFTIPGLVKNMMDRNVKMDLIKGLLPDSTPAAVLELVDVPERSQQSIRSVSRDGTSLGYIWTALATQPRLQIINSILRSQDMLSASLYLTLPLIGRPLLDTVLAEYLPRLFESGFPASSLDDMADMVALSLTRLGRKVPAGGPREMELAFWARVDSFTSETIPP